MRGYVLLQLAVVLMLEAGGEEQGCEEHGLGFVKAV